MGLNTDQDFINMRGELKLGFNDRAIADTFEALIMRLIDLEEKMDDIEYLETRISKLEQAQPATYP